MKTRRHFLKNVGALAAGSLLLPSLSEAMAKVKNPGIQLYTFRNDMTKDARGTLKQIAGLGIKQIESASSNKGNYYGLTPKEMKQVCSDLGMTLRSGHVSLNAQWPKTLNDAAESGQEYLICSSLPTRGHTVENYKKVCEAFNKAGEEAQKMNIKFGYHNHAEEFAVDKGQLLYDLMLDNTDPKYVYMELDLGWVVMAGKDPFDYFKRYPGRFPLWHLKDMDLQKKHSTEFGKGDLDIKKLLQHQKESGLKYFFIEQEEYTSTPLESMKQNMEYLAKMRY